MEDIQCLERRIYERPLTSEPFIENQSEHTAVSTKVVPQKR